MTLHVMHTVGTQTEFRNELKSDIVKVQSTWTIK